MSHFDEFIEYRTKVGRFSITRGTLFSLIPLTLGALAMIALTFFFSNRHDVHPDLFFTDMSDFADYVKYPQPYIGLLSQVGLVFWFSGGSFCLMAGLVLLDSDRLSNRMKAYIFAWGFMGFYLGLDDMLLLHEHLLVVYLRLPENLSIALYLGIFPLVMVSFWREIWKTQFTFFLVFVALLLCSEIVDMLRPDSNHPILSTMPLFTMLEEGSKFLGLIAFWTYCLRLSYLSLHPHHKTS
jgi:hypothetical protein